MTTAAKAMVPPAPREASPSYIRRVQVTGGFLEGALFDFPQGLSCLIGGRGTGKSTLLELVRYALDAFGTATPANRRRIEELVEANLGGGRVIVTVQATDGLEYKISRATGERPVVLDQHDQPIAGHYSDGALIGASVFSQNEIEAIASDPAAQLALIDSFDRTSITAVNEAIDPLVHELHRNGLEIGELRRQTQELQQDVQTLPVVEQQLKQLSGGSSRKAAQLNAIFDSSAARDRERAVCDQTVKALDAMRTDLESLPASIQKYLQRIILEDKTPNAAIMAQVVGGVQRAATKVNEAIQAALDAVTAEQEALFKPLRELEAAHTQQHLAYRQFVEKNERAQEQAKLRLACEHRHNELRAKARELTRLGAHLAELQERRGTLLAQLKQLRQKRYQLRVAIAASINRRLDGPHIRVDIIGNGDVTAVRELLEETLKTCNIQHRIVAQKLSTQLQPSELVAMVEARDADRLRIAAGINANQASMVVATLADSPALLQLEVLQLTDLPHIQLRQGKVYKDSLHLSTGQKCTAVLPILLLNSDQPLLVDQPEDNLDNRFICDTVIRSLQEVMATRQLIFVTHNANIPVLGDARRVYVLESDGAKARIMRQGDVFACREEILALLEGGEDAFRRRGERYDADHR